MPARATQHGRASGPRVNLGRRALHGVLGVLCRAGRERAAGLGLRGGAAAPRHQARDGEGLGPSSRRPLCGRDFTGAARPGRRPHRLGHSHGRARGVRARGRGGRGGDVPCGDAEWGHRGGGAGGWSLRVAGYEEGHAAVARDQRALGALGAQGRKGRGVSRKRRELNILTASSSHASSDGVVDTGGISNDCENVTLHTSPARPPCPRPARC
mmetsp:Transcript_65656/g.207724  ORF Transcript_65656/g.207724 Transcript_65656/m.207724 type:complete len:212 (+) Transcript_65656:426-1061(+)